MLLHVEKEIAAFADCVEVGRACDIPRHGSLLDIQNLLSASSYVIGRRSITALDDKRSRGDNVPACQLAVETKAHATPRLQQRQQGQPARKRIAEMMQHSAGFNDIEPSARRAQS